MNYNYLLDGEEISFSNDKKNISLARCTHSDLVVMQKLSVDLSNLKQASSVEVSVLLAIK